MAFLPCSVVFEHFVESRLVIPSFVESLKDMAELRLVEAIEMRHNGVKFMDFVLPVLCFELSVLAACGLCPVGEAVIGTGEATR